MHHSPTISRLVRSIRLTASAREGWQNGLLWREYVPSAVLPRQIDLTISIAGKDSTKVLDYFSKNGAPCAADANPAEHIVEVIQGNTEEKIDWVDVWNRSEERARAIEELEALNSESKSNTHEEEDQSDFATSHWFQFKMVLKRIMIQLWRSPVRFNLSVFLSMP